MSISPVEVKVRGVRSPVLAVDGYVGHLAALLDQLGITRAHIVVHCSGNPAS